ncbi:gated mechanosensitive channel [Roridomyces roridus]|uniref:Gated mechanosensitive channel n=1 Tax=Roridomyces roridus TaxID=1738132 RepID=A0AAD7C454_9AGAR|nr:gated mechanosensitive channel [Roridomyces roridus]
MSSEHLIDFEHGLVRRAKSVWSGFKGFLGRDNVLEVAVGLIMAGGFSTLVNSLVSDVLLPPIGLLPFMGRNLPAKFVVLRAGPNKPYNTLGQAAEDGAVTLAYGAFLDNLVTFIALGFVLYGIAQMYSVFNHGASIIKHIVKCKYCRKDISQAVVPNAVVIAQAGKTGREEKQDTTVPSSTGLI